MNAKQELERQKLLRQDDTEWLGKYKTIIDGLHMIAEIEGYGGESDPNAVLAIGYGLAYVSKLIDEDVKGRNESEANT